MYKYQQTNVGTRPISVRIRQDLLDWIGWNGINRNGFINEAIAEHVKKAQLEQIDMAKWIRKNR